MRTSRPRPSFSLSPGKQQLLVEGRGERAGSEQDQRQPHPQAAEMLGQLGRDIGRRQLATSQAHQRSQPADHVGGALDLGGRLSRCGHDARIALSTAAQRAGQGMSGGNVMALRWCLLTSASKLIQTSTCSLSATGASVEAAIRHPQRRRASPAISASSAGGAKSTAVSIASDWRREASV